MNRLYVINYDLRKESNYTDLINGIKSLGPWAHVLESCWAVYTAHNANAINQRLSRHLDRDDGLFIVEAGRDASWRNTLCSDEWLRRHTTMSAQKR